MLVSLGNKYYYLVGKHTGNDTHLNDMYICPKELDEILEIALN